MTLSLIAAVARNRAIGRHNQLLWHLPGDLQFFRRMTQGCPVIMGRKTWDSLPERFRPLPGRLNIVVSRNAHWHAPGAQAAGSLPEALSAAAHSGSDRVFVIGGGQLYTEALPHADELILTEVDQVVDDADTFFPAWSSADFEEVRRESPPASDDPQQPRWTWATYRRRP